MATAGRNDNEGTEKKEPPKPKKKLIIIISVAILFLTGIGMGTGASYFLFQSLLAESKADETTAGANKDAAKKEAKGKPPIFIALDSFTVNLKTTPDENQQYLQIGISLELRSDKSVDPIKQRIPQVRNRVLTLLTNSKASDLSTPEGKGNLVEEIKAQINALYPQMINDAPVAGVFFTSFIIQ